MRTEIFADILLILVTSSIIYVILLLVNRGNKKKPQTDESAYPEWTEENTDK